MGTKDTKAKEFLSDNERFADLFNYYLYAGQQVIKAEDLCERDTVKVLSVFGTGKKETVKQRWRDLLKSAIIKTTEYGIFILLGVENQSEIHYVMPIKNMVYDALEYGSQVNEVAKRHKEEKDYVDNYHLHLIIPSEIEDFNKFQTSIGEVLEFIKASKDEVMMDQIINSNPAYKQLDNEAVSMINVCTGIQIPVEKMKERWICARHGTTIKCQALSKEKMKEKRL